MTALAIKTARAELGTMRVQRANTSSIDAKKWSAHVAEELRLIRSEKPES